tara:strand:- start:260 stop:439 length:180 start_codon:yes stop_codon:yes gene_type:complete
MKKGCYGSENSFGKNQPMQSSESGRGSESNVSDFKRAAEKKSQDRTTKLIIQKASKLGW